MITSAMTVLIAQAVSQSMRVPSVAGSASLPMQPLQPLGNGIVKLTALNVRQLRASHMRGVNIHGLVRWHRQVPSTVAAYGG